MVEEIGLEQVRAEAVPLFLYRSARTGSSVAPYRQLFAGILTEEEVERIDTFVPPLLPEPSDFQEALHRARTLAQDGGTDQAWTVLEAALPRWHSDSRTASRRSYCSPTRRCATWSLPSAPEPS